MWRGSLPLADGQRDPRALAALTAWQVKGGREAVEHALEGMLLGGNRAKCAVARSILVIIWHLLADLGPDWHDRKTDRDRKIQAHLRQLRALGLDVTITPAA